MLDDVAMRRPWNLRVKASRWRARARVRRLVEGVTVVIVSWNTEQVTVDTVGIVQRFSPPGTRILVVDNGSSDMSAEALRSMPAVDTMLLGANAGHGVALDLGLCAVRTTIAVVLDSDAVPLTPAWMDPVVGPVRSGEAELAGTRSSRGFVHPMFLAIDVHAFVKRRLSFQVHRLADVPVGGEHWGVNAWDTGELLTAKLHPSEVVYVERTPNRAAGLPGMTAGDAVYHHGGVSRSATGGVSEEALAEWRAALDALGLEPRAQPRVGQGWS